MNACIEAVRLAGFSHLELMATLPGAPIYHAFVFQSLERVEAVLPNGVVILFIRVGRAIGT